MVRRKRTVDKHRKQVGSNGMDLTRTTHMIRTLIQATCISRKTHKQKQHWSLDPGTLQMLTIAHILFKFC